MAYELHRQPADLTADLEYSIWKDGRIIALATIKGQHSIPLDMENLIKAANQGRFYLDLLREP